MNLGAYPEMDRKEDIAYLKWAGFDATFVYYFHREDAKLIRQTAEWLDRAGITLDTIHAPFWGVNGLWRDGEEAEKYFAELQDSILLASECRVPDGRHALKLRRPPPYLNEKGFSRIDLLVQSARDKGIRVAFENQRKIANLAYVMERYENDPAVGFCWDVGHEKCLSGGWEYMPMFGDRLAALHIHDNPCHHNEDLHMIPGDGKIDYRRMAELIRESRVYGNPHAGADGKAERKIRRAYPGGILFPCLRRRGSPVDADRRGKGIRETLSGLAGNIIRISAQRLAAVRFLW